MSDITINSSENQEDNQKTTPVTGSLSEPNDSSLSLSGEIFSTWLVFTNLLEPTFSPNCNFSPAVCQPKDDPPRQP